MAWTKLCSWTITWPLIWTKNGPETCLQIKIITGFHAYLGKVSSLDMDAKPKRPKLLRQTCLSVQDRDMVIGSVSGSYNITCIASAVHNAFRGCNPYNYNIITPQQSLEFCRLRQIFMINHQSEPRTPFVRTVIRLWKTWPKPKTLLV